MAGHTEKRLWTREEAVAALSLYCQIPFGKMHSRNPDVQAVARLINRTPSSVALKLVNFASFDPEHKKRGVSGMSNASKLDREVWDHYYGNWDELAMFGLSHKIDTPVGPVTLAETESTAIVRTRRGQHFFRRSVLAAYNSRCCVTGIESPELLRASHIIPWSKQASSRLDPRNGLALNALHDAAFDRGLISFDDAKQLLVSNRLQNEIPELEYNQFFSQYAGVAIQVPDRFAPCVNYLQYHRNNVFSK